MNNTPGPLPKKAGRISKLPNLFWGKNVGMPAFHFDFPPAMPSWELKALPFAGSSLGEPGPIKEGCWTSKTSGSEKKHTLQNSFCCIFQSLSGGMVLSHPRRQGSHLIFVAIIQTKRLQIYQKTPVRKSITCPAIRWGTLFFKVGLTLQIP